MARGEGADAVDAFGIAQRETVGEFGEGERTNVFAQEFGAIGHHMPGFSLSLEKHRSE